MNLFIKLFFFFFCFSYGNHAWSVRVVDSIQIEGHQRIFRYHLPASNSQGASLIFVLHGSGGSGSQIMESATELEKLRERENLLIVYPDGYKKYWNECRRKSTAETNKLNINESAFFLSMIEYFRNKYGINPEKVFVIGTSGGGHMAYKLAMTNPEIFRGIAAIIANIPDAASSDCQPLGKAIPVLIINGTEDPVNPYNGGEMFVDRSSFGVVQSSWDSFRYWATLAGYKNEPQKTILPDTDPNDGRIIEAYTFRGDSRPEVQLLKVIGGKHDYPRDINVYLYAWDFFKRQL